MVNTTGKNGSGVKTYPPDDVFKEVLLKYAARGLTQEQKISRLHADLQLSIRTTTLNRFERKFGIPSVRRSAPPLEVARQAILDECDKDVTKANGPRSIKQRLKDQGIMVPRDQTRTIMLEEYGEESFDQRFPGKRRSKIPRQALTAIGPFHEISSDGHEKLGVQALGMGEVGLPIYGYKDKYTADVLKLDVVPDCRSAAAIGHLFLDFVSETGAIPLQITTDKGSEVGWQYAIQVALREIFAPDVEGEVFQPFVMIKSVHNTVIEGFWRWFREKSGDTIKGHILRGKVEHRFNPNCPVHKNLFNWIFPPLVQTELDNFRTWWNQHNIRPQVEKDLPSGHVPDDLLENPHLFGGLDCRIRIPEDIVNDLREFLTEEVGPRETYLHWVSADFAEQAVAAHAHIGAPRITFESSWEVFTQMAGVFGEV